MELIDIKIRYRTGAYHASAQGEKANASSSISAFLAGSALINKLHPGAKVAGAETINLESNSKPAVHRFSYVAGGSKAALVTAYCFASGQIEFGTEVPEGGISIAVGEEKKVREIVELHARLSRIDNKTLYVPGVPEAANQREGLTALARFIQWLARSNQSGFRALGA